MRETEAEGLVRDTFRSREHLVHAGHESLVEAVRRRASRRGLVGTGLTALAALLALSAFAVVAAARGGGVHDGPLPPVGLSSPGAPWEGWRWESSLGAQIAVPAAWGRNDYGCNMTAKPSVVRGTSTGLMCLTPEPVLKEVAFIVNWPPIGETGEAPPEPDLPQRPVAVDRAPGTRAEGRLPDGRYAGWITVPSRHLRIIARTHAAGTTQRILDSLRLVDVDHVGCPTRRPARFAPGAPSDAFVPVEPTAISICNYRGGDRLQSSVQLVRTEVKALATTLDHTSPGLNPPASQCIQTEPPVPDAFLLVHMPVGRTTTVSVTFSGCTGRGLDNGVRQAHVTQALIHQVMRPLGGGYGFGGDLPA